MIVCGNCGHKNDASDAFCGNCGQFLEWVGQKEGGDDAAADGAPATPASPDAEAPAWPAGGGWSASDRVVLIEPGAGTGAGC